MIRPIVKDILLLSQKSEQAKRNDLSAACDLADTLEANKDRCVGMAANMIGITKNIIAVKDGSTSLVMLNPAITKTSKETYETEEGCLSLTGSRSVTRYRWIEVTWEDMKFRKQKKRFHDFPAQIIQHEIDHLQGILI